MPAAAARRIYEDQIPSFMSVFDLDAETMADKDTVTVVDPKLVNLEPKTQQLANSTQQPTLPPPGSFLGDPTHKHHDSTSTQASESADSSPTTTLSTTDSSPLSDPSPSSSPDSPVRLVPLNQYPLTSFAAGPVETKTLVIPESGPLGRPMTSPSPRRPRNMKGLSIQPPTTATTAGSSAAEPASPCFIKPKIPGMKRKPSQLSLKTNTSDLTSRISTLEMPSSPAMPPPPILQRRALKHSTSSPHMLAGLASSTFGPAGGMTFPKVLERNESGLSEILRPMKSSMNMNFDVSIAEEDSPIKTQMANRSELEPYHESLNNEDQKSPGYPNGPIAIYGDDVYLYLEPSAEEAERFDVVINVAREVKNPFEERQMRLQSTISQATPADASPIPDTAVTTASFATAFEWQPSDDNSLETPTTPKANPLKATIPEYIHIPWDHNTDIAPDLMNLCETIESRTNAGKKVLIHCQQGASRSASLIIAYGLYQKPELSVNDAYYAAQARSRWISPNMKLMYCLQDFQKEVVKKRLQPASAYRPRTGRSPTKHKLTMSADAIEISPKEARTAPLPGEEGLDDSRKQSPARPRGNSMPSSQNIPPGPSSAPATFQWKESPESKDYSGFVEPSFTFESPQRPKSGCGQLLPGEKEAAPGDRQIPEPFSFSGFKVPLVPNSGENKSQTPEVTPVEKTVTIAPAYPEDEALMSPRVEAMTNNPLHESSEMGGLSFFDSTPPAVEGLFSPRATMFPRDPFSPFGRPTQVADPRSPPTKGETPIVRSIDDIL